MLLLSNESCSGRMCYPGRLPTGLCNCSVHDSWWWGEISCSIEHLQVCLLQLPASCSPPVRVNESSGSAGRDYSVASRRCCCLDGTHGVCASWRVRFIYTCNAPWDGCDVTCMHMHTADTGRARQACSWSYTSSGVNVLASTSNWMCCMRLLSADVAQQTSRA